MKAHGVVHLQCSQLALGWVVSAGPHTGASQAAPEIGGQALNLDQHPCWARTLSPGVNNNLEQLQPRSFANSIDVAILFSFYLMLNKLLEELSSWMLASQERSKLWRRSRENGGSRPKTDQAITDFLKVGSKADNSENLITVLKPRKTALSASCSAIRMALSVTSWFTHIPSCNQIADVICSLAHRLR